MSMVDSAIAQVKSSHIHETIGTETQLAPRILPVADSEIDLTERKNNARCGYGYLIDHKDYNAAIADLENQLGQGVAIVPGQSYHSIRGRLVAFVCNLQSSAYHSPSRGSFEYSVRKMTDNCGLYISGKLSNGGSDAQGYMQYQLGLDFCARAFGSDRQNC
ncbi:hypothetical protein GQ44DRAFT_776022 [Phaeosphaeriaceae sp. PMI808]|nr:hypothetical protein GQ44DRAFT_776022 [Phaeosphaeriaceae sp. PMI808]